MKTAAALLILLTSLLLTGCSGWVNSLVPDVYLVDRHTIMEADAAGEWPELEQRLREPPQAGPQPFAGVDENLDQADGFRILNGEFTSGQNPR